MEEQRDEWCQGETIDSLVELLAEVEADLGQVPGVVTDAPPATEQNHALLRAHAGIQRLLERLPSCAGELRRQGEALRASEKRFRFVADFTYDWEYWRAPDGRYVYVSPSCKKITGYGAEEFLSDPGLFLRIVHPDDLLLLEQHSREEPAAGSESGVEFRILTRNGQTRWIEHMCQPVYDDDGTWLGRRGSNRDVTARKQAEQERERLRVDAHRQRRLVEGVADYAPVGIAVLDARTLCARWANPAYLLFLEEPFRSQGVIGSRLQDFVPRAEESGVAAIFRHVAATGQPYVDPGLEHVGFERGTTYWNWSLQLLPPPPGEEEASLLLLAYDITGQVLARCEAERAANEGRQRAAELDAVLGTIPDGLAIFGPEGEFVHANELARKLLALTPDYEGASLPERMRTRRYTFPDGQPVQVQDTPLFRALNGETVRNEIMGARVEQDVIWISISAAPLRDPTAVDGKVIGAVLSYADVTALRQTQDDLELLAAKLEIQAEQLLAQNLELIVARDELEARVQERTAELVATNELLQVQIAVRQQAEADLRESEGRFRQLAEHIGEMFFLVELETRQVLYVSPVYETLWGRPVQELYRDPDAIFQGIHPDDRDRVRAAGQTGGSRWDVEFRVVRPDGSLCWVRSRAFPVANESGPAQRIAGIVENVTLQKEAQEVLVRAERLHTAGLLAASLSHELNNPLQAAIGCLGLAREAAAEGRAVEPYLKVTHDALERTTGVMAQMRGLYNAPTGEKTQPIDLNELLKRVLLLSQQRCEIRRVGVVFDPGPDLPRVAATPNALQQVFLNMLFNAVDAMAGGGELRITTEHCPEQKRVWVRFADTGGGMEPETLKHLFEPFQSTRAEGLGLGLFISRNLIGRLGGGIEVESEMGKGTTVSLWLPA
ncbi:MAG TPA: PAS domain-containing protein [Anaerolineae bacterium]|nr:PAS domain-containing protein [Anaerolineae bacterium]